MPDFIEILLRSAFAILAIILLSRVHGLRSFSKMSGFDFAITVSIGSVLAGAVTTLGTSFGHFLAALVALFGVQMILAYMRARNDTVQNALDNVPLLVMENGKTIPENLTKAGMTLADLRYKLREANAFDLAKVHAVVVETTGSVSVLQGDPDGPKPHPDVMKDVRR